LGEIHPRTMESRGCKGLFLCGEILDAFGPIGGHNFQWAWATGRAAGLGAAGQKIQPPRNHPTENPAKRSSQALNRKDAKGAKGS